MEIDRRNFLKQCALAVGVSLLGHSAIATDESVTSNSTDSKTDKPNIVLVMADDQGWGQVGYNGHPLLKTPNLDAMAESGIRFNRFYAAGPVCSPTRAEFLTGRYHPRSGGSPPAPLPDR